jgi:thermostable 8-oxoguanine DNA glycosylase
MMNKRMASSRKTNLAFATLAHSFADEDAGKGVTWNRYLEYEIALKRVAMRLGMTVGEMELYLSYNKTDSVGSSPEGW